MQTLANNPDPVFKERIWISVHTFCMTVNGEAVNTGAVPTVAIHSTRKAFATAVATNKATYQPIFVAAVSSNAIAAGDATASGSIVGQTGAQLAASALLVTDAHIDNAVASAWNMLANV